MLAFVIGFLRRALPYLTGLGLATLLQTASVAVEVSQVIPEAGERVGALSTIEVFFSTDVTGVDAGDLLVNGVPADSVLSFGAQQYVFTLAEPAPGELTVSWAPGHGIHSLANEAGALVPVPWSYAYDPALLQNQPYITEFMAENDRTLRDEDGDSSDWIEIYNPTDRAIDLADWALSNDSLQPRAWLFPPVALDGKSFLVVFASAKNRRDASSRLHTNFKLSGNGGVLTLTDPAGRVVSSYSYREQRDDVSYGRVQDGSAAGFFTRPTPGAPNTTSGPGFAPKVQFSRGGGTFTGSFWLTLKAAGTNATIYYSTGNAKILPTESSILYTGPLLVTNSTHVRARAFVPGLLPGEPRSESYLALGDAVTNVTSDLPLVILHNYGGGSVPVSGEQFVMMQIFEPKNGVASLTNAPDLSERARFRLRGSSTQGYAKSSFALETWDEFNHDKKVSVVGMPEDSDWNFYAPNNFEPVLIHNPLMYQLSRDIGRYASRTRFVEVYLNTRGGAVATNQYFGIYVIEEKIKRGASRVDVDKLEPEHLKPPQVTGGYMLKIDRPDPGEGNFSAAGVSEWSYVDPKWQAIRTAARDPQEQYILNYLRTIGTVLNNTALFKDPIEGYARYIDVPASIDFHILNVLAFNVDALRLSTYLYKPREGKLAWGPIWDFDRALGSTDGRDAVARTWGNTGGTSFFQYPMWNRMFQDPDFWQRWIDRWEELRRNQFSTTNLNRLIDQLTGEVRKAQPRELARWRASAPVRGSYQNEINLLKKYLSDRSQFIDAQLVRPPSLSLPGGAVDRGTVVTLSAINTIYYTLDGSDPRLPGGALAPNAVVYTGPIIIRENARIIARSFKPAHTGGPTSTARSPWSGAATATFITHLPSLALTEIMYHPAPSGDTNEPASFEYVEVGNRGREPLQLAGFSLSGGIEFTFPPGTLAMGERIVVVKDRGAFVARYGERVRIAGQWTGTLDNSGERLRLTGPLREPVEDMDYDNLWFPITDGHGFSLVCEPADPPAAGRAAWRPSAEMGGSPGAVDGPEPHWPAVYVSEILSRPAQGGIDQVELFNDSSTPVALGGWFLTDDFSTAAKYRIPAGTTIPPHGYLVFDESELKPGASGFSFSAEGDEAYLFSAAGDRLTGYMHGAKFGSAAEGRPFARFISRDGREHFAAESSPTFGAGNATPAVGPLVLSEVMFQPALAGGVYDNTLDEYIEVKNIGPTAVSLADWKIDGGVQCDFPADAVLPPGGYALVVSFDPNSSLRESFSSRFAVPPGTGFFGPYRGKLSNSSYSIRLFRRDGSPDATEGERLVKIDEVEYESRLPWPPSANGTGQSLQRLGGEFGNDPFSWVAAAPGPGRETTAGDPDGDRDGLPTAWEVEHRLNPDRATGADGPSGDADLDGYTNLEEYIAGTDPADSSSRLQFAATIGPSGATLLFNAAAGKSYSVLFKEALSDKEWLKLRDVNAVAQEQALTVADPAPNRKRFYRLITPAW